MTYSSSKYYRTIQWLLVISRILLILLIFIGVVGVIIDAEQLIEGIFIVLPYVFAPFVFVVLAFSIRLKCDSCGKSCVITWDINYKAPYESHGIVDRLIDAFYPRGLRINRFKCTRCGEEFELEP